MDELQDVSSDSNEMPNEIPNNNRFTLSGEFRMVAKTMQGLEDNVGKELLRLGAREIETHRRAVSFMGDMGTLYKTNYQLRTALRVLIPVAEFEAATEQEFYDAIRALPWEERLTAEQTLAVDCTLSSELFTHSFF
ncbi:MAG: RNA methyltransferase, partial [Bacteroidia bacterium]